MNFEVTRIPTEDEYVAISRYTGIGAEAILVALRPDWIYDHDECGLEEGQGDIAHIYNGDGEVVTSWLIARLKDTPKTELTTEQQHTKCKDELDRRDAVSGKFYSRLGGAESPHKCDPRMAGDADMVGEMRTAYAPDTALIRTLLERAWENHQWWLDNRLKYPDDSQRYAYRDAMDDEATSTIHTCHAALCKGDEHA